MDLVARKVGGENDDEDQAGMDRKRKRWEVLTIILDLWYTKDKVVNDAQETE